jgi:thiamine biosynthesis lipoprotein ApbE
METMMSVVAWGPDSIRLERALDAAADSVERIRMPSFDSLRADIRQRTGIMLPADSFARGYALDRAALAMVGVADSALFDLGGQFLWFGAGAKLTRRTVGIPNPDNSLGALASVEMRSGSVRTTPHANAQSGGPRSLTALAPTALAAGAWSMALLGLGGGCDSALALAPRLERWRVSVVCVDSGGTVRWTPDLKKRVVPRVAAGQPAPAP